jgi:uncharacterized membrane protein
MPTDARSPDAEPTRQIVQLTRLAVIGTLGLALLLLIADFVGGGWNNPGWRFLSEKVLTTLVYAIAAEIVTAVGAITVLALFNPESGRSRP